MTFIRLTLLGLMLSMVAQTAMAQTGFRIETDIFTEKQEQPVVQTKTLFLDGVAYDESRDPGQDITMVDPSGDRVIRFNEALQIKTIVKISKLQEMLRLATQKARTGTLAIFLAGAAQIQDDSNRVTVGAAPLIYSATYAPASKTESAAEFARWYQRFADASKLLDSFSHEASTPPFARVALNEVIAEKESVPQKIVVSMQRGKQERKLTCTVNATWLLSKDDRVRIRQIKDMLANFTDVEPGEYQRLTSDANTGPVRVAGGQTVGSK
ncbi:MAG: hypothetical protein AAGG44_02360 [Planctomycetota bacterium]